MKEILEKIEQTDLENTKISIDSIKVSGKMIKGMDWVKNNLKINRKNILEILLMINIMELVN
jgi:hypothetical protein